MADTHTHARARTAYYTILNKSNKATKENAAGTYRTVFIYTIQPKLYQLNTRPLLHAAQHTNS